MYEYRKELTAEGHRHMKKYTFDAICSTPPLSNDKYGLFGKILFYEKSSCNIKIVSHELSHACLYWWVLRINKPFLKTIQKEPLVYSTDKEVDEQFANLYGETMNCYWNNYLGKYSRIETIRGEK
jgi:hypothetical protein